MQRNQRSNCQYSLEIIEKARAFQKKKIYFIEYAKVLNCLDHNKLWEIFRDGNTRPPYLPHEIPVCR